MFHHQNRRGGLDHAQLQPELGFERIRQRNRFRGGGSYIDVAGRPLQCEVPRAREPGSIEQRVAEEIARGLADFSDCGYEARDGFVTANELYWRAARIWNGAFERAAACFRAIGLL